MTTGVRRLTGYLAPQGLLKQLTGELRNIEAVHGDLVLVKGAEQPSVWAQNIWREAQVVEVASIGDAVRHLKAIQRNWWPYTPHLHRRTQLIVDKLPHVAAKAIDFPALPPAAPLGSFMLVDERTMLVAANCTSPFPNGEPRFVEHKAGPPSRAYLKIWEALTRLGHWPKPGETCLDLGACPGGWTWALARLGANVTAYDRAPLDAAVLAMPGVTAVTGDAFQAKPDKIGAVDWLFSDVICYPERLLEHVRLWIDSGLCRRFVCTLKFQGEGHYGVIPEFLKIPGSRVVHLFNNKHELTWMCEVRDAPCSRQDETAPAGDETP